MHTELNIKYLIKAKSIIILYKLTIIEQWYISNNIIVKKYTIFEIYNNN